MIQSIPQSTSHVGSYLFPVFFLYLILSSTCFGLGVPPVKNQNQTQNQTQAQTTILVVGDSLSAAHGINPEQGWVALLQKRLQEENRPYHVINISTSGDTTRNGVSKLPAALSLYKPAIVILSLGSNDGLRGLSSDSMQDNLNKMVDLSQKAHAKVLLVASLIPTNYGPQYRKKFEQAFDNTAKRYKLPKVPFLLDKVWDSPELMDADGLHPNEKAQSIILENVWPYLKNLL